MVIPPHGCIKGMPQRIVTFKIDHGLLEALDTYAKSRRITRSEAIRMAIEMLLRSEGIPVEYYKRMRFEIEETRHRGPVFEIDITT